MAYEQWQKIKIREEEAIGKLTKKKKKGKQRWRERKMNGAIFLMVRGERVGMSECKEKVGCQVSFITEGYSHNVP